MGDSLRAKPVGVVRWIEWGLTQSKPNDKSVQKIFEVWVIKVIQSRLDNPAKIFREGAARQGL